MSPQTVTSKNPVWFSDDDIDIDDFVAVVSEETNPDDYVYASHIERNVPIYDGRKLASAATSEESKKEIQSELVRVLDSGPGIAVFKDSFSDPSIIASSTEIFEEMLAQEKVAGAQTGDHFAKPGSNDRLWRLQMKFASQAPKEYAEYYSNPIFDLVSSAWLGPMYQMTSDLNVVNPGGEAQSPHRDYHLGFMSKTTAGQFPAHVHKLSPALTLQGAVAHCDMPVETGPTLYLPYSQRYPEGYLAFREPEFREYFDKNYIQLPLSAGDVVFFNPALYHGAGDNKSADVRRMANLLQVSSAFGRSLGAMDREEICRNIFPALREMSSQGRTREAIRAIKSSAEGYAFPTNLDRDQPSNGIRSETQAELMERAITEGWDTETLKKALRDQSYRRSSGE